MPDITNSRHGEGTVISATGVYVLGEGEAKTMASKIITIVNSGSFVGTIDVKARPTGTAVTPFPVPYRKLNLNGSVGDNSSVSTQIATFTASNCIICEGSGLDVVLDIVRTSGSCTVYFEDRAG